MRAMHRLSILSLTLLLAFALGCAATSTREGTGEYFDDSAITTKVKAELLAEPALKSTEITVETFKGVVQLSGFVSTPDQSDKAVAVARKVAGVRDVHNDTRVKQTNSEKTGEYFDDASITAKIKAAYLKEPGLKSAEISVETFKGVVQLRGFVSSSEDMETAVRLARGVKGVKNVLNDTRVKGRQ